MVIDSEFVTDVVLVGELVENMTAKTVIKTMFMIIIALQYLPDMFFANCCLSLFSVHIPNIVASINVNNTAFKPKKNPDINVVVTNANINVFVFLVILFIRSEKHFVFAVTV